MQKYLLHWKIVLLTDKHQGNIYLFLYLKPFSGLGLGIVKWYSCDIKGKKV